VAENVGKATSDNASSFALPKTSADDASRHCWHLRVLEMAQKKGHAHITSRCCWCGGEQKKFVRKDPDNSHGPKVKGITREVVLSVDESETCARGAS
jgi:hypothetical protein